MHFRIALIKASSAFSYIWLQHWAGKGPYITLLCCKPPWLDCRAPKCNWTLLWGNLPPNVHICVMVLPCYSALHWGQLHGDNSRPRDLYWPLVRSLFTAHLLSNPSSTAGALSGNGSRPELLVNLHICLSIRRKKISSGNTSRKKECFSFDQTFPKLHHPPPPNIYSGRLVLLPTMTVTHLINKVTYSQGLTGRVFQLRVGSGSGIKNYFGWGQFGSVRVSGICIKYQVNRVLKSWSGIRWVTWKYPIILKKFWVWFGFC